MKFNFVTDDYPDTLVAEIFKRYPAWYNALYPDGYTIEERLNGYLCQLDAGYLRAIANDPSKDQWEKLIDCIDYYRQAFDIQLPIELIAPPNCAELEQDGFTIAYQAIYDFARQTLHASEIVALQANFTCIRNRSIASKL